MFEIGFFDKINFGRKKKEEQRDPQEVFSDSGFQDNENYLGFESGQIESKGYRGSRYENPGFQQQESFQSPSSMGGFSQQRELSSSKEMELISAKLDTIKLMLENLDRRVANLERIAEQ